MGMQGKRFCVSGVIYVLVIGVGAYLFPEYIYYKDTVTLLRLCCIYMVVYMCIPVLEELVVTVLAVRLRDVVAYVVGVSLVYLEPFISLELSRALLCDFNVCSTWVVILISVVIIRLTVGLCENLL